jgi:hypothetical protein
MADCNDKLGVEGQKMAAYEKSFGLINKPYVPASAPITNFQQAVLKSQIGQQRPLNRKKMFRVKKSQLVELKVFGVATTGNTGTRFQFQDQPYLRFKPVTGIETFNVVDVPTSPTGAAIVSAAQLVTGYLTLYINDVDDPSSVGEWIQNVPMTILKRTQDQTAGVIAPFVRQPFLMAGQTVIWDKSYITLATPLNNTTDLSFIFNVYFEK